jgi:hypothetical protein
MKTARLRYCVLLAMGVIFLALTRPYEGMLLCLPVVAILIHWALFGKNRPKPFALVKLAAIPLTLICAASAWLGYYDYRAFGNPLTLPYTVNRATYAMAPYYVWQSARREPAYRRREMRSFYYENELTEFSKIHSWSLFIPMSLGKVSTSVGFFAGFALLPPLIMLRRVLCDRRIRFLVICVLILIAGNVIMVYLLPHYLAPFTAAIYAIGLQAMRHLRVWTPELKPVGVTMVRLIVTVCLLSAGLRLLSGPLKMHVPEWPTGNWTTMWFGPDHYGTERFGIESYLERLPGKQLVLVRYAYTREPMEQWVYNLSEIDNSKVVWAGEGDFAGNRELLNYYNDRKVWLVEPDATPARLSPYQSPSVTAISR